MGSRAVRLVDPRGLLHQHRKGRAVRPTLSPRLKEWAWRGQLLCPYSRPGHRGGWDTARRIGPILYLNSFLRVFSQEIRPRSAGLCQLNKLEQKQGRDTGAWGSALGAPHVGLGLPSTRHCTGQLWRTPSHGGWQRSSMKAWLQSCPGQSQTSPLIIPDLPFPVRLLPALPRSQDLSVLL